MLRLPDRVQMGAENEKIYDFGMKFYLPFLDRSYPLDRNPIGIPRNFDFPRALDVPELFSEEKNRQGAPDYCSRHMILT